MKLKKKFTFNEETERKSIDFISGERKSNFPNGEGSLIFADGSKYSGDFKDGKKEGKGIFIWANDLKYEGEWKSDKQTGYGIMTCFEESPYLKYE